jgi:hypothetical protein
MRVHIIHLPERQDRLALFKAELEQQNIQDFQIWEGIEILKTLKKAFL